MLPNILVIRMKNTGKTNSNRRDEALYEAYKRILSSRKDISHAEAVRAALLEPQPCMWVSFYGVYRALLCLVKGSKKSPKSASRGHLLEEVERKYRKLREKKIFKGSSLFFLTAFIISEPSQGFYVSEKYANRIIWKVRKERRGAWKGKN